MIETAKKLFEQFISPYSYSLYHIAPKESVYLIEDSIIVHMSIRPENNNQIVIEEIFNDGICDLKLTKFAKNTHGVLIQFFPYLGGLGISNPRMKSRYNRVNEYLPELKIPERYNKWQGFTVPHMLFELTEGGNTGYAICATRAKQTVSRIISVGEDLLFACVNAEKLEIYHNESMSYFFATGLKYHFTLDRTMVNIMLNRLCGRSKSGKIKKATSPYIGIEEDGLRFCWINARTKVLGNVFNGEIIDDVKRGYYDDVDRYDFSLPDNKWKSEQLVYNIVQQLYPTENVYYQYRPNYLLSGKGQLSYDIYIAKYRIAIEYQGKQHFEPVRIFGGVEGFEKQRNRDQLKLQLSKEQGVTLIYINYWEDISVELVRQKIAEAINSQL